MDKKGKIDLLFSIGTEGKISRSNEVSASIIVCGKETVTLTNQDMIEKLLRTDVENDLI